MTTDRAKKYQAPVIILLVAIIITGSIIAWTRYRPGCPVEISIPPPQALDGEIYIGGAVNNPGYYPLAAADSIELLIRAAGGTTANANPNQFKLLVPEMGTQQEPQKVDLNRAEAWLLETLPGIGETRAQAIIDYRTREGPFRNINELTRVEGIGATTYEQIKHLITVAD
ncbi:MAG: ComEA family DNA-binding protein [Chloroflexota bacterium]|nr:ComEA family DNA-binding protein [Chloroflexota bacterium]